MDNATQEKKWQILHDRITETLDPFGTKDPFGKGDYWLLDENWGWEQQQLEIQNLSLLHPSIVKALQALLAACPHWDISVSVAVPGIGDDWPGMGLLIYQDEIIDELQRGYFPPAFRNFFYEGARPWKVSK